MTCRDGASFFCSQKTGSFLVSTFLPPVGPVACGLNALLSCHLCWKPKMSYQDAAGSQSLALCHDGNVQGFGQVARIKQLKPQMRNSNFQSF